MQTGPLYSKLKTCDKKIIICQGGGDAGKTSDILKFLATDSIETPNTITTVTGMDLPNLRKGALLIFQKYIEPLPEIRMFIKSFNDQQNIYKFHNGSFIQFSGFGNELDARGSERDNLFINECNTKPYMFFWQLNRKTRRHSFLDYNPTSKFWVHDKLLQPGNKEFEGKVTRFIIDHRHNPFLSKEDHEAYENISDPDLFRVYSRGLTGKIKGLIFGHFREIERFPDDCNEIIYGIDFGYTNDQTALVKIGIKPRQRFCELLCYEPGIQPERIYEILKASGHTSEVIYSEHDKNIIIQLRRLGLPVNAAHKGPGSVAAGISKVRGYECFYVKNSDFKNELDNWKFVTFQELSSGKEIQSNVPQDGNDHACQASIYGIYSHSFRRLD